MSGAVMVLNLHFSTVRPITPHWLSALIVNEEGQEINFIEIELVRINLTQLDIEDEVLRLLTNLMSANELTVVSKDTGALESYLSQHMPWVHQRLISRVANMDPFIQFLQALPLEFGLLAVKSTRRVQDETTLEIFRLFKLYEESIAVHLAVRA